MAIDPAKDASLPHGRRVEPAAQRPNRTRRFFFSQRDRHGGAGALAVGLRAPNRQHDLLGLEAEVGDVDRDELAAAQRRRPADEQQRPIAQPPQIRRNRKDDAAQGVELERCLLRLRYAELPAGAAHNRPTTTSWSVGVAWSIERW